MSKEAVITTSRLNSYGFRVLTEGVDIEQYEKNPVLLWMHTRPMRGTTDEVLPLGRMENLRVEGDALIGTPVFDMNDEFARKVADKWEQGILRMVSAELTVMEESNAPEHLVAGQVFATVTKSRLREVSIVDIGANDDALALYSEDRLIDLKADGELGNILSLVSKAEEKTVEPINNNATMKTIALRLGLAESATLEQIVAAIETLQNDNRALRHEREEAQNRSITLAVEQAIADGKITADKKQHFVELGQKAGLEALGETLKLMSGAVRPTDVISPTAPKPTDGEWKTLREVPVHELSTLRAEHPETYRKLYAAEYGRNPEM